MNFLVLRQIKCFVQSLVKLIGVRDFKNDSSTRFLSYRHLIIGRRRDKNSRDKRDKIKNIFYLLSFENLEH